MLLRHGRRYTGKSSWTAAHERHLATVRFAHPAQNIAYAEYRGAVRDTQERVERLTEALRAQAADWRLAPLLAAVCTLRGLDRLPLGCRSPRPACCSLTSPSYPSAHRRSLTFHRVGLDPQRDARTRSGEPSTVLRGHPRDDPRLSDRGSPATHRCHAVTSPRISD
jgi:hypothetical protein